MNSIPKEMSHSKVGQDFPKPDLHFDGHAANSTTVANEIEALDVFQAVRHGPAERQC